MLNAVVKLISLIFVGWFMVWATYKIGSGLGYWLPFVMVMVGLVSGLAYNIAKWVVKNRSKK
jgi:hypothetical protein